jgi:NAD(P) transhydrogenase subunit beta
MKADRGSGRRRHDGVSQKVIIVPGYGMAVAQAQHKVWELCAVAHRSRRQGAFAIHPVAGRMPGHMNVLLAEAGVPYDLISDLDEINAEFETADVALIIGANDVVNPVRAPTKQPDLRHADPERRQGQERHRHQARPGRGFLGHRERAVLLDNTRMLYGDRRRRSNLRTMPAMPMSRSSCGSSCAPCSIRKFRSTWSSLAWSMT